MNSFLSLYRNLRNYVEKTTNSNNNREINSFLSIFRNYYLRSLIRNNVFKDTIIDIPSLEYLNDNHQYLSVFSNDDKLQYNIYIKFSFNMSNSSRLQFRNNNHTHLINDINITFWSKEEDMDFCMLHDQLHRLSFCIGESIKINVKGKLPDSIIELRFNSFSPRGFSSVFVEEILSSDLPKNLRVLYLSNIFSLLLSSRKIQLPNSIVDIECDCTTTELDRFVTNPNKALTNTSLKVSSVQDLLWLQEKQWISKINITDVISSQIAAHVRKISFYYHVDAVIEWLPKQLEWLDANRLTSQQNQQPLSMILKTHLPCLKSLNLREWHERFDQNTFPETLEYLQIYGYDKDVDAGVFSSKLKTLRLSSFNQEIKIGTFPNTITLLSLESFDQSLQPSFLPNQLKYLYLDEFQNTIEPNSSFPVSLKSLQLNQYSGFFPHFVGKMDNIRELNVGILNQSMVDALTNVNRLKVCFGSIAASTSFTNTSITDLWLYNYTIPLKIYSIGKGLLPTCLSKLRLSNLNIQCIDTIPPSCLYLKYNHYEFNTSFIPQSVKNISFF
ncbi:hypothetical protein CYY_000223 [Polysphondylium violaceum]|uniref:FNIP repeat-containing protein n=1 Tax=Polysphondylium violaceum TaxID=133409 RepID=A0A8J4Q1Z5_9MYCE|nr:hypothetical protein CYY_000223 [Polysphondylium violaceum]